MTNKTNEELERFQGELSGSRKGLYSGTYIAQMRDKEELQRKEKKQREFSDLILDSLIKDLERLASEIEELTLQRRENLIKLKYASDLIQDWDQQKAKDFLAEQGFSVQGKNDNTLRDMVVNQIEVFVNRDSSLAEQIANKAREAETKMKGHDVDSEFSAELLSMVRNAESIGIDADRAITEAYRITNYANKVLIEADSELKLSEKRIALGNTSISFANDEDDPFSDLVDNITDPFNAIAAGLNIGLETKNGLNQEAVSPTIKSEVLTLKK